VVLALQAPKTSSGGIMEDIEPGEEQKVAMRDLRGEPEGSSCADCKNVSFRGWFLWCRFFDKPTTGRVNGCSAYQPE
jgi:hypothetical protein